MCDVTQARQGHKRVLEPTCVQYDWQRDGSLGSLLVDWAVVPSAAIKLSF